MTCCRKFLTLQNFGVGICDMRMKSQVRPHVMESHLTQRFYFIGGKKKSFKSIRPTLASVAQLVEHPPTNQKVTRSIPTQGIYWGYRFGPQSGCLWKATNRCFSLTSAFLSLSFALPSPFSEVKSKNNFFNQGNPFWETVRPGLLEILNSKLTPHEIT